MNILFLGNSLLIPFYEEYRKDKNVMLGACSFAIDIGGTGPAFKIIDEKIIPSDRVGKEKYPDIFSPISLLDKSITSFDLIILVAPGYIGGGLGSVEVGGVCTAGLLHQFKPNSRDYSLPLFSQPEFIEVFNGVLSNQSGIKLLDSLKKFSAKKIVVEQPFLSDEIISHSDWSLSKLYHEPISAYRWFCELRRNFLYKRCAELDFIFMPALFDDLGFTPSSYVNCSDLFHTDRQYAKLMYGKLSEYSQF